MEGRNYIEHTFIVSSFDIDVWGVMKPSSILNICQDTAYLHSKSMGYGFDVLHKLNMTWVLSRVKVAVMRSPSWLERVKVRTWHKGQSGLFSLRDYIFYDQQGEPIIKITTSWLILNLATRRIARVDKIFNQDGMELAEYKCDAIEVEAPRIEVPSTLDVVGTHKVLYSDLDLNEHVNNTKYMDWACDHSPQQMQREKSLKAFCLNFNHEAKHSEQIVLSSCLQENDLLIEGSTAGRNIFVARLEYSV